MGAGSQPEEKFTLKIPPKGKRVCYHVCMYIFMCMLIPCILVTLS